MKKITLLIVLSILASTSTLADVGDLLITEVVITPAASEFVEIYNNGATAVDLTDVYLTDATFAGGSTYYYQVVNGAGGGGGFADFHSRFPNGASIASGEYQTIALNGATNFIAAFNVNPTYELYDTNAGIPDMLEAFAGSINGQGGLSDGGEVLVLYSWDGTTDLVQDLDYVLWGDKVEAIDKTGVSIDGPDGDMIDSNYLNDTTIGSQAVISTSSHAGGMSWQRNELLNESNETQSGGNGFNGSDETSEDLNNTFFEGTPSPNAVGTPPPPTAPSIIINEVDAVGTDDFVEIKGPVGASLNDVTLVFYQGSDDTIYRTIDLSGNLIANGGYFLISDTNVSADIALSGSIDDQASAVAIYFKNVSNFSIGDPINDVDFVNDIIDAMVYHSGAPDDGGLLALLNTSEPQVNEDSNALDSTESNARCADGQGGVLNTSSYMQVTPTAGTINNTCPVLPYYLNADPSTPVTLRTTLHDIIKGHTSYPYSAGTTDTWDMLGFADEDHNATIDVNPNVAERIWTVYSNDSYDNVAMGNPDYNREHTWPQSYGFNDNTHPTDNAPRTDGHHLMLSNSSYNSDRGNNYFDNCSASCTELTTTVYDGEGTGTPIGGGSGVYPGNSNWFDGDSFEVWGARKGDVARAIFYMDVRYENLGEIDSTGTPEPDLVVTDDLGLIGPTDADTAYLGLKSVLLEWHANDPVDDIELERNEVVFSYQGNRNPFVDHPEWVACIFESICGPGDAMFSDGFED
jgi:endonuclease I